jgi:hypothetical protein
MSGQTNDAAERSAHVTRSDHDGPKPLELRDGVIAPIADLRDRVAELEAEREALRAALRMLHDDVAEYQRINHLGGYDNHVMRVARAALDTAP